MATYNDAQNTRINTHRHSDLNAGRAGFNPTNATNGMLQTSTNIFIYANGGIVGMIQSFAVSESRGINKLNAIGFEGVVQAVPQNTNGGQLTVARMALYNSNIYRALGLTSNAGGYSGVGSKTHTTGFNDSYGMPSNPGPQLVFRTLKDQRVPIEIKTRTPMDGEGKVFYEETYVDCWLASYSKSFAVGEITVTENATIQYGDVF